MKRIRNAAVLTALLSSFSSGALRAAENAQDAMPSHRADRAAASLEDGVSRAKFVKRAQRHFDEMDRNGDGMLSREEAREWARKQRDLRDERRQARKERENGKPRWMEVGDYTQKEHLSPNRSQGAEPAAEE